MLTTWLQEIFIISVIASALTEGTKKILDGKINLSKNLVDLIWSFVVVAVYWTYQILQHIMLLNFNSVFYLIALLGLSFVCSTCGYDKVKQLIEQLGTTTK